MKRNGMSHEQAGREGGKARWVLHKALLVERFIDLDRADAIWAAYRAGHHAGRVAKYQATTGRASRQRKAEAA